MRSAWLSILLVACLPDDVDIDGPVQPGGAVIAVVGSTGGEPVRRPDAGIRDGALVDGPIGIDAGPFFDGPPADATALLDGLDQIPGNTDLIPGNTDLIP